MLITVPKLGGNFTQVPNELIRCKYLTAGQKETWLMVASVCWHGQSSEATIGSMSDVAKTNGVAYTKFWMALKRLRSAGGIEEVQGGWKLLIPDGTVVEEEEQLTIAEEIQEQPKRKHTMTQKEVWEQVKEEWNKNKPESFFRLDGAVALPWFIALETQAKRLGIDRPDYGKFVGQVCRGAAADDWWSKRDMKFTSIFGYGALKDRQFENVEKLYKAGAKIETKTDYNCDADILARYHEKGIEKTRVIRLEAEDHFQAAEHLGSIPESEYDDSAVYLYFAPGKERPIYWSLKSRRSTMYLFS